MTVSKVSVVASVCRNERWFASGHATCLKSTHACVCVLDRGGGYLCARARLCKRVREKERNGSFFCGRAWNILPT